MSKAKVTLMGFETWTNNKGLEESLYFDFLTDEENEILRETFIQEYYERPLLIMNPDFFYRFIRNACRRTSKQVESLYKAWLAEYEPLENYDRIEETYVTSDGTSSNDSTNNTNIDTKGNSNTDSTSSNLDKSKTVNSQSAFNNSTFQPHDSNENTTLSDNTANTTNNTNDNTKTNSNAHSDSQSTNVTLTKSRIHGNIGVTTSSAMKKEFIDTTMSYNFYKKASELIMVESQCFYYLFN